MADKTDALAAIGRYFATPAGHDLGAGVFNLYLRAVQERRGVCQITGADFLRMGKMLVLLDAPALVNTDAADKADAERALTTADESTSLDERKPEESKPEESATTEAIARREYSAAGRAVLREAPTSEQMRAAIDTATPPETPPAGGDTLGGLSGGPSGPRTTERPRLGIRGA